MTISKATALVSSAQGWTQSVPFNYKNQIVCNFLTRVRIAKLGFLPSLFAIYFLFNIPSTSFSLQQIYSVF